MEQPKTEKTPISLLFDSIPVYEPNDIEKLLNGLEYPQSINYAYKHGIFSMEEIELISKSLRNITLHKCIEQESEISSQPNQK
jgi:hypothetical protein